MSGAHQCDYVSKTKAKTEEINRVSEDETDEACLKERQLDAVNSINKNSDFGILKEQNTFNEITSLSNLYSNKNYTNNDYISSKRDKQLAGLNDIRSVCDDFKNHECKEDNSLYTNLKSDPKKKHDINSPALSPKIADNLSVSKEVNGVVNLPDVKPGANNMSNANETVYYAVHIPTEIPLPDAYVDRKENLHVYTDREEVLTVVKLNKKARFKQFKTRKEAEEFAINGAEIISQDGSSAMTDNEKIMPFKRPKTEDMIQFRKDIERGDIDAVREKIFENPKYLVSNGDTPSILQEGSRYNALHVAAKSNNANIARLILDSITRLDFIGYLYDDNDVESCIARSEILLDRYLNTPDKGSNETPLHLAVKHGAVEVVKVLLSYSQCQKNNVFNRFQELPKDIICTRVKGPCEETKAAIASMLEDQYFVPVLRSEDNSLQPKVGEAFSLTNPLKVECDLLSPRLEIQAYAGPMSKEKALLFKKKLKTPSRSGKGLNSSLQMRLRDTEKGLEKTGRNLASELNVPWQEYWSFLDTFVDISSKHGLNLLENYLKNRFAETLSGEETFDKSDTPKEGTSEKGFCPIRDLCEAFEMCGAAEKQPVAQSTPRLKRYPSVYSSSVQREHCNKKSNESVKNYAKNPLVYVERSCEVFGKRIGAAISSCVLYDNHAESLKECLETQTKHLLSLIKSYKEDNRFQSVDFQLIHSRVAAVAIQSLLDVTERDKHLILSALNGIDWSDGALSDDEDPNYSYRSYNSEWLGADGKRKGSVKTSTSVGTYEAEEVVKTNTNGVFSGVTTKQLHCLVKHLLNQLHNYQESAQISPSARDEKDCQILWALASPCGCTWGLNSSKRSRSGLKRKQFRNDCECDCDVSPRKIQFDDEKELNSVVFDSEPAVSDECEDHFSTPSSGNSDTEDDTMEDVKEIPNTFIFPGSQPTKTDYTVAEAIENVPLSPDKYPNIYLWRHILQMQPKPSLSDHQIPSPDVVTRRILNFDSPKSSPCKLLDRSFGSSETTPSMQTPPMEPWERVIGPYSPRRSTRLSSSMLYQENLLASR